MSTGPSLSALAVFRFQSLFAQNDLYLRLKAFQYINRLFSLACSAPAARRTLNKN